MVEKARDERLGFRIGLANGIGQPEMVRVLLQGLPNEEDSWREVAGGRRALKHKA